MQVQSQGLSPPKKRGDETLFSKGSHAFQSVLGQVGWQPDKQADSQNGDQLVLLRGQQQNVIRSGVNPSSVNPSGVNPSGAEVSRRKPIQKEGLWNRAALLKAALGNSASLKANQDSNADSNSAFSFRETPPSKGGKTIWRSVETRVGGVSGRSLRKLNKRELELKRLELRPLLNALRFVESSNRVNVPDGDDGTSIGPLQISLDYHHDVWQKMHPWDKARNIDHAEETVIQYWSIYCPKALETQDYETLAKVHNGGPQGPSAGKTTYYWSKVLRHLKQQQEVKISPNATHISPRRAPGAGTKWKDAPRKADRAGPRKHNLPWGGLPSKPRPHPTKPHRHAHHAKLVRIRVHSAYKPHAPKTKRVVKGSAAGGKRSPAKKKQIIHSRRSSFSSTATYGHFSQASSNGDAFASEDGRFSLTAPQTPSAKTHNPAGAFTPRASPYTPNQNDLLIRPGDSISQRPSPSPSEASPGSSSPGSPGADSHSSGGFQLGEVRTDSQELSEREASEAEALLSEIVQQVDRKRGALKLGFKVSPRARLSPPKRKRHPFRASVESEADAGDVGHRKRGGKTGLQEVEDLVARQEAAGTFQSDSESDSGLSDDVSSPVSSAGSLSPDKAFSVAYLQAAIRRSQKKVAAVMIQRAYQKHRPRRDFVKLRTTTVRLQQLVRAWQSGRPVRAGFLALRRAATLVQKRWRAERERQGTVLQAVQARIRFLCMRKAAVKIQRVWRGYRVRAGFVGGSAGESVGVSGRNVGECLGSTEEIVDKGARLEFGKASWGQEGSCLLEQERREAGNVLRLELEECKRTGGQDVVGFEPPVDTGMASETCREGDLGKRFSVAVSSYGQSALVGSPASTPPMSPRREEELYRQLAELQVHYAVHEEGDPFRTALVFDLRTEELAGRSGSDCRDGESDARKQFEFVPVSGFRTEDLAESFGSDAGDSSLDAAEEAPPPLSPRKEEALYAQLAELLPPFGSLDFVRASAGPVARQSGGETGGSQEVRRSSGFLEDVSLGSGSTVGECVGDSSGPSVEESCEPAEETRGGQQRSEGTTDVCEDSEELDLGERGVEWEAQSPEGPLSPISESMLLMQLASLIAKRAPVVTECAPAGKELTTAVEGGAPDFEELVADASKGGAPAMESELGDGENEVVVVLLGEGVSRVNDGQDGALEHLTNGTSERSLVFERSVNASLDEVSDLLAVHQAALRALKEEKVASWTDRKPLDMVATAGDSCLAEALWAETAGGEYTEVLPEQVTESGVLQEEEGLVVEEGQTIVQKTLALSGGLLIEDVEAVSVPEPESFTAGDVSGDLIPHRETEVQVFGCAEVPSSGDCTPEHYPPTESDASVFALQKPERCRTPVSSPALILAETALLDSASKVASWNDTAANVPLSEENLRVSIAPPGDVPWGYGEDFARAKGSPDWAEGFPEDSWTNSPSHRSFADQDSSLGEIRVLDCPSPDKSLGLVRAEVEKLNSMQKGRFSPGRVGTGQLVVNGGKPLRLGSTEWAQMRLGLGLLKQWLVEHESPEKAKNARKSQDGLKVRELENVPAFDRPARPEQRRSFEKRQTSNGAQKREETFALIQPSSPKELWRTSAPGSASSSLSKSRSAPSLNGSPEPLDANPAGNPLGYSCHSPPKAADPAGLKRPVVRRLTLPLKNGLGSPTSFSPKPVPDSGSTNPGSSPQPKPTPEAPEARPFSPKPSQDPRFELAVPVTPPKPSPHNSVSIEPLPNPETCDSPDVSPAVARSPERGVTFDSFAAPPLVRLHSAPQPRTSYAHSPHRPDGRDCLVCRLWEEGSFAGFIDSPRARAFRNRGRGFSQSWSNPVLPPVSRSPSSPSLTTSPPEVSSGPSIRRTSSLSLPAKPGSSRGSADGSLSRDSSLPSNHSDHPGTSRGSLESPRTPQSSLDSARTFRGSSDSSPSAASHSWSSSPSRASPESPSKSGPLRRPRFLLSPRKSPKPPVSPNHLRSQSFDNQHNQPAQKPKSAGPKPPRPAGLPSHASPSPSRRHVSGDVTGEGSPRRARFELWGRRGGREQTQSPSGGSHTRNAPATWSSEAPAGASKRASDEDTAQSQREFSSNSNERGARKWGAGDEGRFWGGGRRAVQTSYHRDSQNAQVLDVKARAGLSPQAMRERNRRQVRENGQLLEEMRQQSGEGGSLPARVPPSPETSSDTSSPRSPFTPLRHPGAKAPPTAACSPLDDVSNSLDDVSAALQSFSIERKQAVGSDSPANRRGGVGMMTPRDGGAATRDLETDSEYVTPYSKQAPREAGSTVSPEKSPAASVTLMPTLAKLCQLWEERHVDLRVRAHKYRGIVRELTSLGTEVRMVYYVSPTWGPPSVMKELEEVGNLKRSVREEQQAADLVLRQRDCIHKGLSLQLNQAERLRLYAAWGVRRWSTGRLRRIIYKLIWLDPVRCDQSADLTTQFL